MYKEKIQKYLTHEQRIEVAKYLAEFHTPKQAQYFIEEKFGMVMDYRSIEKSFLGDNTRWKPIVEQFRAKYVSETMETPIANKRVRLERYDWLYEKAIEAGKFSAAKACLDSAREETETGKVSSIGSLVFTQFNNMSDEELHSEKDKLLEKLEKLGHKPRTAVTEESTGGNL